MAKGKLLRELVINQKPPSMNKVYRQAHWGARKNMRNKWHRIVSLEAAKQKIKPVDIYPVNIYLSCEFDGRRYDPDNLAAICKLITDGLCEEGILHGDSPIYVNRVVLGPCILSDEYKIIYQIRE